MNNNELQHWGIKGMRWGIRRKRDSKTGKVSSDAQKASKLRGKKLSEMSNEELKTLNTRLQLERTYKDLSKKDTSAGKKFVSQVLQESGKNLASKYVAKAGDLAIQNAIKAVKGD